MYVETKIASVVYGVATNTFTQCAKRNSDKYTYRYIDGVGRGGKALIRTKQHHRLVIHQRQRDLVLRPVLAR